MSDVTRILSQIEQGDPQATEKLLPLVYDELRKLAAAKLAKEKPGQTLQATALVHEAFMRLVDAEQANWNGRAHFFGAAAEAMRRILVERARHKVAMKSGGQAERLPLTDVENVAHVESRDRLELLALDEALSKLERQSARKAELVKLRYFVGLTLEEAAEALGISLSTASADWLYAKGWLRLELRAAE
jgi:RNA polymerase sigma factor (TIGR02999 family)